MAGNTAKAVATTLAGADAAALARRDWASLYLLDREASPFLAPSWVAQWLQVHAQSLRPLFFTHTGSTSQLVAAAILVPRIHRRGPVPFHQLFLNTDGESPQDSVVVENNRLLCAQGHEAEAFAALAAEVKASRAHEFIASGIDQKQLDRFLAAFPDWVPDVVVRESPIVDLERVRQAGGDLLPLLSANTRAQIRRALRRYREQGDVTVEVAASGAEALSFFEELVQLHEQRWQQRGQRGAFASAPRRAFHRGFIERAIATGEVAMVRVRVADRTIGVLYLLTGHGFVNFYQSGFEAALDPHLKPGLVTHYLAIQYFCERGHAEYDFLASLPNESRYKQSLSTSIRPLHWLTLSRPTLRNSLLQAARKLRKMSRA